MTPRPRRAGPPERAGYPDVPVLQLLREAGDVYREAVRRALEDTGCDDIPRNGAFVLDGLDHSTSDPAFAPQAEVVASLRASKQLTSQLIDTLVVRDYLERRSDPLDRRRMEVRLTARGRNAASAIQGAVAAVEAAVAGRISRKDLQGFRAALGAYRAIREAR